MELRASKLMILTSFVILLSNFHQLADAEKFGGNYDPYASGIQPGDFTKAHSYEAPNIDVVSHNGGQLPAKIVVHHHYHPPIYAEDVVQPADPVDVAKVKEFEQTKGRSEPLEKVHAPVIHAEMVQSVEVYPGYGSEMEIQKAEVYSVPSEVHNVHSHAHAHAQQVAYHRTNSVPLVKGIGHGLASYASNYNSLLAPPRQYRRAHPGRFYQYYLQLNNSSKGFAVM